MKIINHIIRKSAILSLFIAVVSCEEQIEVVTAEYSYSMAIGQDNTVQYNNESQNGQSYSWDFNGDGSTDSTIEHPKYTYPEEGDYTTVLTVTGNNDEDHIVKKITVQNIIEVSASFTYSLVNGEERTIQFTNNSINGITYSWDFNNDGIEDSTEKNPKYTYETLGEYTTQLTVTGLNNEDISEQHISIIEVIFEVTASYTSYIVKGEDLTIQFTNTSINSTSYYWDFNNDGYIDSTEENPKYTFTKAGNHNPKLTAIGVNDADSFSSQITTIPIGKNEVLNPDFSLNTDGLDDYGSLDHWQINNPNNMHTSPYNGSNDGSKYAIDDTYLGRSTQAAKYTYSSSYDTKGAYTKDTRFGYQELTLEPNTEYVLAYDYAISNSFSTNSYVTLEILPSHYEFGEEAVNQSDNGAYLIRLKGDIRLGKASFRTNAGKFTTNNDGNVSILMYATTEENIYVDNVKVIKL